MREGNTHFSAFIAAGFVEWWPLHCSWNPVLLWMQLVGGSAAALSFTFSLQHRKYRYEYLNLRILATIHHLVDLLEVIHLSSLSVSSLMFVRK